MSRNQIQPYESPPDRGAGRRRDSPVFDSLPGEAAGGLMQLPYGGNGGGREMAMGNAIQPRDKMAQYRDAALVRGIVARPLSSRCTVGAADYFALGRCAH